MERLQLPRSSQVYARPMPAFINGSSGVVVSAYVSPSERNAAFLVLILAIILRRSGVDRARRSSLAMSSTSPIEDVKEPMKLRAVGLGPAGYSLKTCATPAAVSTTTCAA